MCFFELVCGYLYNISRYDFSYSRIDFLGIFGMFVMSILVGKFLGSSKEMGFDYKMLGTF